MDKNIKSYFGKRGYILNKKHFSDELINEIKNELTVKPYVNDDYGTKVEQFKVYTENANKLYIPKFYGIQKLGQPELNRIPHGQDINIKFNGKLRENQLDSVNTCLKACESQGGGILALPCASGKTIQSLYVLTKLGKKALIIVHKEFLLNQWIERIEEFLPDAKIGIIQQDKVDIDDKDIVIAMLQSISMKDYALNTFDSMATVIIDECFPGDTKIITDDGDYTILELYERWLNNLEIPLIKSYNEELKMFEYKKLTYSWKKLYNGEMIKINLNNNIVKCTPNHKILTINGYKEAHQLKKGDIIISLNDKDMLKDILNNTLDNKIIEELYGFVNDITIINKKCDVFDIEVEDNHNFVISNSGIVVHNCHHISSKVFSRALRKINSQYMIGLSATPNRKDGLTKVFKWYIGDVVYSKKHQDSNIVNVERLIIKSDNEEYSKEYLNYRGNPMMPKMINNIVQNLHRTKLIVYWIKELLKENRKIIVLSDRRAHLEDFYNLLKEENIDSVGYYVGGMKQADLDISATKSVILGTFHISSEGLDIPGLDTEILATPKSDIVQSVGRILRKIHTDKPAKIIDVVDKFSLFENQALKRCKLYNTRKYIIDDITVWDKLDDNGEPQILKKYRKKINTKNSTKKSNDLFINNFNNKSMFSNDTSNDTSKSNNNMLEISNKDFDKYKSMFS